MTNPDSLPSHPISVEYQLRTGKSDLLHERDEVFSDGALVGHLERLRITSKWTGVVRGKPAEICLMQPGTGMYTGAAIHFADVRLSFGWTYGKTNNQVQLECNAKSLNFKTNGTGGYSVLSASGVEMGTHSYVWRESETKQGIRSKATLVPSENQEFDDTLALFLLFLYQFDNYSFPV